MMRFLLPLIALLAQGLPAVAADVLSSGEGLLEACEELQRNQRSSGDIVYFTGLKPSACWGFIGAIQQTSRLFDPGTKLTLLGVCAPPESELLQLIRVFTTFAKAHPELLHERPAE